MRVKSKLLLASDKVSFHLLYIPNPNHSGSYLHPIHPLVGTNDRSSLQRYRIPSKIATEVRHLVGVDSHFLLIISSEYTVKNYLESIELTINF